jgi:hypothetical protein
MKGEQQGKLKWEDLRNRLARQFEQLGLPIRTAKADKFALSFKCSRVV